MSACFLQLFGGTLILYFYHTPNNTPLEYLPGGAAPAQALVRLDGSSASIPFEKLLKGVCLDNETVWRDFNECNASFESLACWGHHFMGLPWER